VVIYEVNLTVEPDQVNEYSAWLDEHIRAMLELDGFESAALYARADSDDGLGERQGRQRQGGERQGETGLRESSSGEATAAEVTAEGTGEGKNTGEEGGAEASGAGGTRSSEADAPDRVPAGKRHWTVHYHLTDRDALDRYFEEDAERMRSEGADKFEGQFSAERRVLESRQVFSHQEG
jgi:hypothetical protein